MAALCGALFASCENMGGDVSPIFVAPVDGGGQGGGSGAAGGSGGSASATGAVAGTLTASVRLPGLPSLAGIAPVPENVARYAGRSNALAQTNAPASNDSAQASDGISKSAFPNIADAAATAYSFSATLSQSGTGGATYTADGSYDAVEGKCSFSFGGAKSASEQSYTLTVELYHASGTPAVKSLVASGSQSVTVGADAPSFSASVSLFPNLESGAPNGSLKLPIKFSDTSVTSVQLTLLDSDSHDVTSTYLDDVTGTPPALTLSSGEGTIKSKSGGLPPGTYTLLMTFMKGTAAVGSRTESLNVYPAMETSLWWTKDGIGAAATALSVTQFNQKEFYVRGTGGVFYTAVFPTAAEAVDTNNGSFAFPLKTIQEAVNRITASGDTTSQFTVYIDGKIEGDPDADYSSNQSSLVRLGSTGVPFENKILIKGWTGPDTDIIDVKKSKDSVKPGRAFYIKSASSAKVIVKDLGITHSAASGVGGAFYIISCSDAILENCKISECYAATSGGGIYMSQSNLELKNSVVTQSEARSGGGVFVHGVGPTAKGCLTIEKSEISANSAASGGGVCVNNVYSTLNFLSGQIAANTATYSSTVTNSGLGGGIYINTSGKCFISGAATIGQSLASTSSCATSADGSHSNMAVNGGGIYNKGELYLGYTDDSTPAAWTGSVCYNYASSDGGGILSYGSSTLVKMNAGSVAYNLCGDGSETTGGGGGVAVQNSSAFTMSGGTVSFNQTNNKVGGGIYVDGSGTLALSGDAEVSSNKTSADGTGTMGGAGLFAYRASITMEGNAVVKDNLCKACGGGVYLFEFESASSYASLAMSGNAKILGNTSSDGLGGAVYVTQRCSFSMQGAATIPAGVAGTTGAGKNDVYLDENTSVAVPAAITSTATPVAAITPKSPYAVGATVLTGAALSDAQCAKFALTQPAGVEFPWTIEYDSTNGGVLKHDRNVFYVADYGDNTSGDGTKDNPYETIKFALTKFTDKMPASVDFKNKIYVLTDMTYDAGLGSDVPCYYEIVGCNGGTVGSNVTFTFNTPDDSGLYVAYGQKIKLTHIDITQSSATANNYAAILVENSSTNGVGELWMEDCSIKNMYANACSAIAAKGDVHLKNVEISGNKTVANTSGATPFGPAINSTTGTVSVLGKVVVKDNQMQINTAAAGDPPSYVYKDQNLWIGENTGAAPEFHKLDITGALTESDIGVTLFDYGTLYTTFTSGFASAGISAPSDVFASDDGMSVIKNISSGEAIMTAPASLYVSQTGSDLIGNGSRLAPFATIQKALDKINALDTSGISYTIYVRGTVKGYAEIPDGVKAAKITIDKDPSSIVTNTLDGVGKASPVLTINAAIPVDISNLTITRGSRGVDIEKSATVKITDCVITLNDATGKTNIAGAGIYVPENSAITPSLTITGGEVSSNTATGLGGGIYFGAGTLTIENVEISGNEATGTNKNGGGLYVGGTGGYVSGFTMTGGSIDGNTSSTDGGGATINCKQSANALLDGVTISGNTASAGNGGGIAITSGKYLSVKDCIVINNTATGGNGGGIYNAGTCYIYGSTAIGEEGASSPAESGASKHSNLAGGNGGGIYSAGTLKLGVNSSGTAVALTGGVYYNFAGIGGGIYNNSGTVTMSSGTIQRNGATNGAGGVYNRAVFNFSDGLIDRNNAPAGAGVYTGGTATFTMSGGTISNNAASATDGSGGGICATGTFSMTGGTISGNSALLGGGIYSSGAASMSGTMATITGNSASYGGGLYVFNNVFTMSGGSITANTATNGGGGVLISSDINSETGAITIGSFAMSGGSISANTASPGGGVLVSSVMDASSVSHDAVFDISDDALIPAGTDGKNDVYLEAPIRLISSLNKDAPVATITPSAYNTAAQVLIEATPGLVGGNYDKIAVTPQTISGGVTKNWTVNSSGYLAQLVSGGGAITIHTPEGDLNLTASATTITTSASDTTVTISATDASGSAITNGLAWNGVTVYYGADEIDTATGNSYKFKKTFPKGTYRLNVSVTYKGTTYSDSFTIKKTVEGAAAVAMPSDFKKITAGSFTRKATSTATTAYTVTLTKDFYMCEHEVTQKEWYEVMGVKQEDMYATDKGWGDNYPVYYVNWYAAIAYCNKRSIADGLDCVYEVEGVDFETLAFAEIPTESDSAWDAVTCDWSADGYRLPTEMEWQYAALGDYKDNSNWNGYGDSSNSSAVVFAGYNGTNNIDGYAWYTGTATDSKTHEVKKKSSNSHGLCDMSGNVREWCWDRYADDQYAADGNASDPLGALSGSHRVYRGGGWGNDADYCSVASRHYNFPYFRNNNIGLRVVRNAP